MRALSEMQVIQIDITNACHRSCSNCTRFCGHHKQPFFMDLPTFRRAVDSLVDFPGMVGIMGGEPLLHPEFPEMARYLRDTIRRKERRGLFTTLPPHRMKHAELIREVFGHMSLNDHASNRVLHQPVLVASEEVVADPVERERLIDNCWVQLYWSASITPKGAFFCEVAAAMSQLFDGSPGWPVEPGWWRRGPADFTEQRREFCNKCGCSVPLKRRPSTEEVDDVSPGNLARLEQVGSPKVRRRKLQVYTGDLEDGWRPGVNWHMSMPDEHAYRQRVADRLGVDVHARNQFANPNNSFAILERSAGQPGADPAPHPPATSRDEQPRARVRPARNAMARIMSRRRW